MGIIRKSTLEARYNVPVIVMWKDVPDHLITRTTAKKTGYLIPEDAKPDAIKGGGLMMSGDRFYFLYDKGKYQQKEENDNAASQIIRQHELGFE